MHSPINIQINTTDKQEDPETKEEEKVNDRDEENI